MRQQLSFIMPLPKKEPRRNRHHLIPKSRCGKDTLDNLLMIEEKRHQVWHKLFGEMTLDEAIELLMRLRQMKRRKA